MAESRPLEPFELDLSAPEVEQLPVYRRLSTLNGLLIGLALGLGAWGSEMVRVSRLPVTGYLPTLLLGLGLAVLLGGLAGWITGRFARTVVSVVIWAVAGMLFMLLISYLPFYGRTLTIWLADPRFWGRDIFPFILDATPGGIILGGFFIILMLAGLALLQGYRLENLVSDVRHRGRLGGRGWLSLLLPLPIVFLVSMVTHNNMANPSAAAVEQTNRGISVAQGYEGDLRLLDMGDGISYAALRPVQELIDGEFTLSIVDINPLTSTVVVRGDFDSGAWIYCRVINDQLSFCYDASLPYTFGLRSLATGEPVPEDCRTCMLRATDEAAAWLAGHRDRFGADPAIERVAQQGSHVLMRLTGDGGFAAECRIEGISPMQLVECKAVGQ